MSTSDGGLHRHMRKLYAGEHAPALFVKLDRASELFGWVFATTPLGSFLPLANMGPVAAEIVAGSPSRPRAGTTVIPVCPNCYSEAVVRDAAASYDPATGQWDTLNSVHDAATCLRCDSEIEPRYVAPAGVRYTWQDYYAGGSNDAGG